MDAELSQFADDLLQSVREMNENVRARETKVAVNQILEEMRISKWLDI